MWGPRRIVARREIYTLYCLPSTSTIQSLWEPSGTFHVFPNLLNYSGQASLYLIGITCAPYFHAFNYILHAYSCTIWGLAGPHGPWGRTEVHWSPWAPFGPQGGEIAKSVATFAALALGPHGPMSPRGRNRNMFLFRGPRVLQMPEQFLHHLARKTLNPKNSNFAIFFSVWARMDIP